MVAAATLRDLLASRPHGRVVSPGRFNDDEIGLMRSQALESTSVQAQTVDGAPFVAHDIAPLPETAFTHFLDGAQRAWRAGYDGVMPYYLAHTSAAILERRERDVLPP